MSCLQSRLFAASLLCVTISGCASSGVGTPLPSGGKTEFLVYAPTNSSLKLIISGGYGDLFFARDLDHDNDPNRPAGTPADYVAYTAVLTIASGTYDADLMTWSPLTQNWEFVDDVDAFQANTLVLIEED